MKQSKLFPLLFPFIMMAIPWIYLAIIWKDLPAIIPTHFGVSGVPDKFGDRSEVFIGPAALSVIGILLYFLLRNLHRIDPKRKYSAPTSSVLSKLSVVIIILLCAVSLLICHWTVKGKVEGLGVLFCIMGLFLAYIGNLFHSIKPNYFAGLRLPWTLESEDNWRMTHQFASKIWFAGGLVLAVLALILPVKPLIFTFMGIMLVLVLVPAWYSYDLYRKNNSSETPSA